MNEQTQNGKNQPRLAGTGSLEPGFHGTSEMLGALFSAVADFQEKSASQGRCALVSTGRASQDLGNFLVMVRPAVSNAGLSLVQLVQADRLVSVLGHKGGGYLVEAVVIPVNAGAGRTEALEVCRLNSAASLLGWNIERADAASPSASRAEPAAPVMEPSDTAAAGQAALATPVLTQAPMQSQSEISKGPRASGGLIDDPESAVVQDGLRKTSLADKDGLVRIEAFVPTKYTGAALKKIRDAIESRKAALGIPARQGAATA